MKPPVRKISAILRTRKNLPGSKAAVDFRRPAVADHRGLITTTMPTSQISRTPSTFPDT
jgi:hypothetical protein